MIGSVIFKVEEEAFFPDDIEFSVCAGYYPLIFHFYSNKMLKHITKTLIRYCETKNPKHATIEYVFKRQILLTEYMDGRL